MKTNSNVYVLQTISDSTPDIIGIYSQYELAEKQLFKTKETEKFEDYEIITWPLDVVSNNYPNILKSTEYRKTKEELDALYPID